MIRPLRKRHWQIWMLLSVLFPLFILLGWLVIPNSESARLLREENQKILPVIMGSHYRNGHHIRIRTDLDYFRWQLEWHIEDPITVPTATIYKIPGSYTDPSFSEKFTPGNAQLIGRIEAKGKWVFDLKGEPRHTEELNLVLYDFIHEMVIDRFNLKISH